MTIAPSTNAPGGTWLGAALVCLAGAAACAHRPPVNPKATQHQAQGVRAYAAGDLDRAAGLFSLALEYEPKMPEARNGLGLVALARGNVRAAEEEFRKALAVNEDFAEAHNNLGYIFLDRGDLDEALDRFRRALAIDPGFGRARLGTGETLLRMNKMEEARWELAKLCEVEPRNARAHAAHAQVLALQGRIAQAEASAQRALALDANLPEGHRARGEILKRRGDFPGAVLEYRAVLKQLPLSVDDRVNLVVLMCATAIDEQALRELDGLEKTAPTRPEVAFARAFVLLQQRNYPGAIAAARRSQQLKLRSPMVHLVLSEALFLTGAVGEARSEARRFLDEAPAGYVREREAAEKFLAN
jgi:Flp pilus assembly protein TadD